MRSNESFPQFYWRFAPIKLRKNRLFSVIWRVSRAIIFCLSVLLFAVVPVFAESYPNRPTAGEMDEIVALGTECMRGVNERCLATQYQTNPVAYRVAPFTNTRFYLDQNLMGAMAAKIRALVPYYVDPATVYNGTTNITMLAVTGLWAQLEIGDHTNQFTSTPAIGTNAAMYGDYPWRIYVESLEERYAVLNAMQITHIVPDYYSKAHKGCDPQQANYANMAANFALQSWVENPPWETEPAGWIDTWSTGPWSCDKNRAKFKVIIPCSDPAPSQAETWIKCIKIDRGNTNDCFLSAEAPAAENTWHKIEEINSPSVEWLTDEWLGNNGSVVPDPGIPGTGWTKGWMISEKYAFINWNFQYCVNQW